MPRAAFEALKADFQADRLPAIVGRVGGEAVAFGERLLTLYRTAGRDRLLELDPLTRFWILRFRGMPEPADLAGAPAGAAFVMAFTAFPYLDGLMDLWSLGRPVEGGHELLVDGLADGRVLPVANGRFDLMPLYRDKADALEAFVASQYGGDFERFMLAYVAEHDLAFDLEQAWRALD